MDIYLIVKKHIDEMDYLHLLESGAPDDEFDLESKMIANEITDSSTIQGIACIIKEVFNDTFDDKNQPNMFMDCAKKIHDDIHDILRNQH